MSLLELVFGNSASCFVGWWMVRFLNFRAISVACLILRLVFGGGLEVSHWMAFDEVFALSGVRVACECCDMLHRLCWCLQVHSNLSPGV
jgi:hypothetical protein